MIHIDLIRKKIKELREQRRITTDAMAEALHIDVRNYIRIENGERKKIDIIELDIICDALGITLLDLLKQGYFRTEKDSPALKELLSKLIEECAEEKSRLIQLQRLYIEQLTRNNGA